MIDNHRYTDSELAYLFKDIPKLVYIGDINDDCDEKFIQLKNNDEYIPYVISSFGRIFSINYDGIFHNVKRMKTHYNDGYERITVSYSDVCINFLIHRLVAENFIYNDDPEFKIEVNHIDGNKSNNTINNLEWVTPSENMLHAFKTGLKEPRRKYTEDIIHNVCKLLLKDLDIKSISEQTGVSIDVIRDVISHKSWLTISSQYDLSKYHYGISDIEYKRYITNIYKACIFIEENRSIKYIKKTLGMTDNQIYKLLKKRVYKNISDNYDFSHYNYGLPYDYIERLNKACKYAESGKYTEKEISEMVDIPKRKIHRMLTGETWKDISSKYNLSKYKK